MEFIDTNVLVNAFHNNEHMEECQEAIRKGGIINTLNLAETFHILEKITNRETAEKSVKSLLNSDLEIIDLDINLIFQSLKNSNKYNLSIFDLIHYICAMQNECESIISYDNDFDNLTIKRKEP